MKKSLKADIEFTLDGVEYSLTPMKQKVAANVFHNCLSHVLAAIAQAVTGDTDAEKMAKFAQALGKVATFDDVWFILENMMRHAMVDDKEIGDLNGSDIFDENPHHMYLVIFHGVKGNWPNYFSKMEAKMSDFASTLKQTFNQVGQVATDE
jgi:aminopeptidase N